MKWAIALIGLILLAACSPAVQQTSTAPAITKQAETTKPQETILEPEAKEPQQPVQDETAAEQVNESKVPTDCKGFCEWECERNAHLACNQEERSQCKANCGATIDPSACSQACSFINQPAACKTQMESFCKNQCVAKCK